MNRGKTSKARKIPGAGIINTVLSALVLPIWLLALAAWAVQAASLAAVQAAQGRGHYLQARSRSICAESPPQSNNR